MTINRRSVLFGLASLASGPAIASSGDDAPLILRPEIEGVHPRYASYATSGPYIHPSSPMTIKTDHGHIVVFHPRGVSEARLVVFSHGALSDPLTYRDLIWQWVSHGFVVVAPLHSDAVIENGPTLRVNKAGEVSRWPIASLLEDPKAWQDRVDACRACLDAVEKIAVATGIEIIMERPIISGHGYGAYVAQLLLGATVVDADGARRSFLDPRFFAGIIMSPQGPGVMGLDAGSWSQLVSPALFLLSENDLDFTGQPSSQKRLSYESSKPGYKHLGMLMAGSTNTFSGQLARTNAVEKKLFEVTKAITTCFLQAYADYNPVAFEDLTSDFFERMSLDAIMEERR